MVAFVDSLFESAKDFTQFKGQLRDFLVQSKEFVDTNNADLWADETQAKREADQAAIMAIPGMQNPNTISLPDEMA